MTEDKPIHIVIRAKRFKVEEFFSEWVRKEHSVLWDHVGNRSPIAVPKIRKLIENIRLLNSSSIFFCADKGEYVMKAKLLSVEKWGAKSEKIDDRIPKGWGDDSRSQLWFECDNFENSSLSDLKYLLLYNDPTISYINSDLNRRLYPFATRNGLNLVISTPKPSVEEVPDYMVEEKKQIVTQASIPNHFNNYIHPKMKMDEPFKDPKFSKGDLEEFDDAKEGKIFEIMLGGGEGLKRIEDGRPAVICVEDNEEEKIIGIIETICARLYREKKGGRPEPIIFTDVEEFKDDLRSMKAEGSIIVVRLKEKDWNSLTNEEWERFRNRLDQLFSQDFGFIILNTSQPRSLSERHRINVIEIRPKQLTIEMKKRFAEILWGFVEINESLKDFDQIFEDGRYKFEHSLKGIENEKDGIFVDSTNPHDTGESNEHLWMKWFLVKYLVRQLIDNEELPKNPTKTQIKNKIWTEVENKFHNSVPDVAVGNDVYEVETLFSEDVDGKIPRNKITTTIDKYDPQVNVNIVFENITFFRHLKTLRQILKNYEKDGKKNIRLWTLDLKNEKLLSLDEILNVMKEIQISDFSDEMKDMKKYLRSQYENLCI